jgi:DNA-binding transcriptional regulator YiaG
VPPRDLTALAARDILKTADLRGLRKRAGISAATLGEALDANDNQVCAWERRRHFPRGWRLAAYARVIGGLARHEQIGSDGEEVRDAAA